MSRYLQGYLECALWSSYDYSDESGGKPMDNDYGVKDIAPESLERLTSIAEKFRSENSESLEASGLSEEQWGHDLWLTQNRHGSGFWGRGLPEILGSRLTDAAHACGSVELYIGDDGLIHAFPPP
jgi:hypothetical protein